MPIENISQPEIINICTELRIRKFDHKYSFALDWYQDKDTVILVDGLEADLYDYDKLNNLQKHKKINNEGIKRYYLIILKKYYIKRIRYEVNSYEK